MDPVPPHMVDTFKAGLKAWLDVFAIVVSLLWVTGIITGTLTTYFRYAGPAIVVAAVSMGLWTRVTEKLSEFIVVCWFVFLAGSVDGAIWTSLLQSGEQGQFLLTAFTPWGFASYIYAHLFMGRRGAVAAVGNLVLLIVICGILWLFFSPDSGGVQAHQIKIQQYVNALLSQLGALISARVIYQMVKWVRAMDRRARRTSDAALAGLSKELDAPIKALEEMAQALSTSSSLPAYVAKDKLDAMLAITAKIRWMAEGASTVSREGMAFDAGSSVMSEFDIGALLSDLKRTVERESGSHKVQVHLDHSTPWPHKVVGDAYRVKRVAFLMIDDVLKQTKATYITVSAGSKTSDFVEINLSFRGETPSQDAHEQQMLVESGRVGMIIAITALKAIGGAVSEIKADYGSWRCTLTVPLNVISFQQALPGNLEKADEESNCHWPNVLIVDDSDALLSTLTQMLAFSPVRTTCAKDGQEAIELLAKDRFDLVLCDIQMPRVDGYGVVMALRDSIALTSSKYTPFVAMSAEEPQASHRGTKYMNGFLSKPFMAQTVRQTIEKMTGRCMDRSSSPHQTK